MAIPDAFEEQFRKQHVTDWMKFQEGVFGTDQVPGTKWSNNDIYKDLKSNKPFDLRVTPVAVIAFHEQDYIRWMRKYPDVPSRRVSHPQDITGIRFCCAIGVGNWRAIPGIDALLDILSPAMVSEDYWQLVP